METNARKEIKRYGDCGAWIPVEKKNGRWYCERCYEEKTKDLDATRAEYGKLKKKLMLERAVTLLEDKVKIYEYQDIIEQMAEYVEECPEKFDSSDEMIAAIIFIANQIKVKMQYKVASYTVDFLIPDLRVIVEIDGERHLYKREYDNDRDITIRATIGSEWEVIRIPTKLLEQNPEKLVQAVIQAKQERQRLRGKNHGGLPWNYR